MMSVIQTCALCAKTDGYGIAEDLCHNCATLLWLHLRQILIRKWKDWPLVDAVLTAGPIEGKCSLCGKTSTNSSRSVFIYNDLCRHCWALFAELPDHQQWRIIRQRLNVAGNRVAEQLGNSGGLAAEQPPKAWRTVEEWRTLEEELEKMLDHAERILTSLKLRHSR